MENDNNIDEKKPQTLINKDVSVNTPYNIIIPKRKKLKGMDILSIHSQLIRKFISGEIMNQDAKDLSYLCSNYLNALQLVEYEQRISKLEKLIGKE